MSLKMKLKSELSKTLFDVAIISALFFYLWFTAESREASSLSIILCATTVIVFRIGIYVARSKGLLSSKPKRPFIEALSLAFKDLAKLVVLIGGTVAFVVCYYAMHHYDAFRELLLNGSAEEIGDYLRILVVISGVLAIFLQVAISRFGLSSKEGSSLCQCCSDKTDEVSN